MTGIWDEIQGQIKLAFDLIQGIIKVAMDLLQGNWKGAWEDIKATAVKAWDDIKQIITGAIEIVKGLIQAFGPAISSLMQAAWSGLEHFVTEAWAGIEKAVGQGIDAAVALVQSLPGKITGALGDLGSLLFNAGAQIVNGLLNGLKSKLADVQATAANIAKVILDNKGPEAVDLALLVPAGKNIITGLINGMNSQIPGLITASQDAAENIAYNVEQGLMSHIEGVAAALRAGLDPQKLVTETGAPLFGAAALMSDKVASGLISNPGQFRDVAEHIAYNVETGLFSQTEGIFAALKAGIDPTKLVTETGKPLFTAGGLLGAGLASGLTSSAAAVAAAADGLGTSTVTTIASGITKGTTVISAALQAMMEAALKAAGIGMTGGPPSTITNTFPTHPVPGGIYHYPGPGGGSPAVVTVTVGGNVYGASGIQELQAQISQGVMDALSGRVRY